MRISATGITMSRVRGEARRDEARRTLTQTVGGATGAPLPRPVGYAACVEWRAPTVRTPLTPTSHAVGTSGPEILRLSPAANLTVPGEPGTEPYHVLDGVLSVE